MIFDSHLFLAFPLRPDYISNLELVPIALRALYIRNLDENYLSEISHKGQRFLAKNLGSLIDFQALESAQIHIYSVLKKLIPDFPYNSHPLVLLALPAIPAD